MPSQIISVLPGFTPRFCRELTGPPFVYEARWLGPDAAEDAEAEVRAIGSERRKEIERLCQTALAMEPGKREVP